MSDMIKVNAILSEGKKYRIRYKLGQQKFQREAVMVLLGHEGDSLQWDARPAAGTQTLNRADIIGVEHVSQSTTVYINRVTKDRI